MTPEQEQKVLDAAAVVNGVFPQFDRRLEQVEDSMGRMADETKTLHERITTANGKIDTSVLKLTGQMEEIQREFTRLAEELAQQTSILRKWEEAQEILAKATATPIVVTPNGAHKADAAEENGDNGNGNGNGNGANGEKKERQLYEAIGRVVVATGKALFGTPRRIITTISFLTSLGGATVYLKGCSPHKVMVPPTPTVVVAATSEMGPPAPRSHHNRNRASAIDLP